MTHEMEPIAHLTFEAVPFDLTSLPTDEQDAKARRSMLPMSALLESWREQKRLLEAYKNCSMQP